MSPKQYPSIRTEGEQQSWLDGYSVGFHDAIGDKKTIARVYRTARAYMLASGVAFFATVAAIMLWQFFK